ncbi:MAG TPA: DUF2868 domain-containing protein [Eoetvoesiella sp.]
MRLREEHWGPLEDAAEVRRARAEGRNFPEKILLRAQFLARREKVDLVTQKWAHGAKFALIGMLIAAMLTGAGAAMGALGDGTRSVNILLALAAMLGLHCLTFIFWLFSFSVKNHSGGAWLGQLWLWLTQKLARGPDAALTPRALVEVLGRNGALRWVLSSISHGLWTGALLSLLITLLAVLSARRYGFNWETTLLSGDTFVHLTAVIGWLPSKLGFAIPPDDVVRASNGLQALPESAHTLWSSWLIGCVVVYGLLPRGVSLVLSLVMARHHINAIHIDENMPAYANLRERLQPTSERIGIDAPDGNDFQAHIQPLAISRRSLNHSLLVGLELPPDTNWPPQTIPDSVEDRGIIDTRAQRKALLDELQQHPPAKLLIVCDGRQTPDRGTVALVADLASIAHQSHVSLMLPASQAFDSDPRTTAWYERLAAAGFSHEQIHASFSPALDWLNTQQNNAQGGSHAD